MKKLIVLAGAASLALLALPRLSAADHAAVGAEKCAKMCHKVQFESWGKSKHAAADPKVECETCHGNGADFMKLTIMKDPAKAKAAGLISKPDKAACLAKCHKPEQIKDEMLATVHDHKKKP